MTWNGSGSIIWPYDWTDERDKGNPDNVISATKFDEQWASAKADIEACLNRNGENAMAADLSMGTSYHLTNLAAGSSATDSITMRQVADNSVLYGGTTGGSSNAYTVSDAVMSTNPAAGMRLLLLANHTNSGASTLNLNASGAVAIVRRDGATALASGDIVSGDFIEVAFDGTSWVLLHTSSSNETDEANASGYQPLDSDLTAIAALSATKGNLIVGNGSAWTAESVGTNTYVLTADSTQSTGVKWALPDFPSGTSMVFYQASAPTGWTAEALNDRALRVVSAGGTGGSGGGSTAFSSVLTSRTIAQANLPNVNLTAASNGAHTHFISNTDAGSGTTALSSSNQMKFDTDVASNSSNYTLRGTATAATIGLTSSNGAHTHTVPLGGSGTALDFAVHYSDVIIATKD